MHSRNTHQSGYDIERLLLAVPELKDFLRINLNGQTTIAFEDPKAVLLLNKALLLTDYQMTYWDLPKGQLCPPVPGRADYIHYIADLISESHASLREGNDVKILDIGVGANLIYPIVGVSSYKWSFVGADCNQTSIDHAKKILERNEHLKNKIELRHQPNSNSILHQVILPKEHFDALICNPPFYKSATEAQMETEKKVTNLHGKNATLIHNFGGQANELWFPGGEHSFVGNMIIESTNYASQVSWFTALIAKKDHLKPLERLAKNKGC